ncbi:MAG TPA: hypothetical protein VLT33_28810 [Labilithrix sp.]|nr:hypothetical protein [Labilithrix sp.]
MLRSLAWAFVPAALLPLSACGSSEPEQAADDGGAPDAVASDATPDGGADAGDPSFNADPQDLDPASGDPSLDLAGSWIYFDGGKPWVRAVSHGSWPPASTLYSWSCQIFLSTENAPVVTYTVQSLSGTQTDYAEGMDKAKITFATEAKGFRVLFADATLQFDRYALQCAAQKAKGSTRVQDDSGSFTFKTKEQRTFGP